MKQHLESLMIDRFRGLRNLELQNLGRVNLFVGPNNSGKTSVLEAVSIYSRSMDALEWLNTARRRESIGNSIRPIIRTNSLRWLFPQNDQQTPDHLYHGEVRMKASGRFSVQSLLARYQEIRGIPDESTLKRIQQGMPAREPDATYQGAELQVNIQSEHAADLFNQPEGEAQASFVFWDRAPFFDRQKSPALYSLPVRTITPVSHRTEAAQVERFSETALNREIGNVLDLVRLFDPDITGMQILGTWGTSLYIEHKKSGLTPLSAFGDGLRRVVMIALTLPNIRKGILLIDEIETAIHVSVLNEVYQWLFQACEKYDIQLFATTHSLEAVDALLSARDSRDGLVAYQLGQADEPAKRFSGEMIGRLRLERGLDIRGGL